jgi:hypothetical protein
MGIMYQNKVGMIRYTDVIPDSCAECVCSESSCYLPMKKYPHHDELKKAYTQKRHPDCPLILEAKIGYCQACGRGFASPELIYYVPLDGNIVCSKCAEIHKDRQLRIYMKEE